VLAAAAAGGVAYAAGVERRWYVLRHATVPVLGPAARRPLRVLHLSDLHLLPGQDHKHRFVQRCLDTGPDLVVATGDLLGHPDSVDAAAGLLAQVRDRPALAVLGSNDFYGPTLKNPLGYFVQPDRRVRAIRGVRLDTPRLVAGLESAGWTVLENGRTCVDTPAGPLDVVGLGDPHIRRDRPDRVDWGAPPPGTALRLGLVHAPYLRALGVFAHHGYGLVLAGHTHGGQLRLPVAGALVNNCDLPLDRSRGLSRDPHDGAWLHVSAGLGTSRFAPVRFACRPEATLLDLVPAR
jgi:uncharacterized protein